MILIDTSAWIEFLRRQGAALVKHRVAQYLETGEAAHCGPIEFELRTGARPQELGDLETAFSFSTLLEFPDACWRRAAELERSVRAKGVTVPRDDLFVAAAALHHRLSLYASDPHFALIRDKAGVPLLLA
jgi:predicted nucleic acid-binding protein